MILIFAADTWQFIEPVFQATWPGEYLVREHRVEVSCPWYPPGTPRDQIQPSRHVREYSVEVSERMLTWMRLRYPSVKLNS